MAFRDDRHLGLSVKLLKKLLAGERGGLGLRRRGHAELYAGNGGQQSLERRGGKRKAAAV